ncbi:ArnT family glycosyltransferase [Yinghuangia seranimata]|uniref:ArnT family glycosyltransferase n=1 Tax=Yinghuangia seranimata TaxID=408067 RepID=UPI00248B1BD0|nr:glycosyltransferase family 39 protein [Yinghuangia seranimata]MDI2126933.1 glycosyltransferase family 39 protein [Yinghuangia seranimata]
MVEDVRAAVRPTVADHSRPGVRAFAGRGVGGVAVGLGAVLTAVSGRYGFHRDELYFLAAGRHLDWGYDDQPPLTPLLARASTELFGESPAGLRVVATLAAMAIVVVVGLVAREFGGGARVQVAAAGCAAVSGLVLAVGHMVSTATFDVLMWLVVTWVALRLLRTGDVRWWFALGLAVGVGGQNKDLVVLLVGALLAGVLVAGPRRVLAGWWPLAGAAVALVLVLPNLWWQATHGWPQLAVAHGISGRDGAMNRTMFVPQQLLFLSPLLIPVWVAGLRRLLRDPELQWARSIAYAYGITCVFVVAVGGKAYYALPLLIVIMAAGCEPVLDWVARGGGRRRARGRLVVALGVALAASNAVLALPLLPPEHLAIPNAIDQEQGEQVGWQTFVHTVADGWAQIPADERPHAVLYASNYGEAGALARYGPDLGLPYPYSGHVNFYAWGRPSDTTPGPVLIVAKKDKIARQESHFTDCRQVGLVDNGHGVDNEEQHAVVLLCAGPAEPWSTLWPKLRKYY